MTASNFPACLQIILASEGGFTIDSGGPTEMGITETTLARYLGRSVTVADVKALTPATVAAIYRADYWSVIQADTLPSGIDLMAFDEAVNQGPGRAIRTLQAAVSVTVDGALGPQTMAALASCNVPLVIDRIVTLRTALYHSDATWNIDGKGWMARLYRTASAAHGMVEGKPVANGGGTGTIIGGILAPAAAPQPDPAQTTITTVTTSAPTTAADVAALKPLVAETIKQLAAGPISVNSIITDSKPIWQSRTFWGLVVVGVATGLQQLGYNFTTGDQSDFINDIAGFIQIGGGMFAMYGRVMATKTIGAK